ncbi:hypothetical protein ACVJGD_008597 [Bradyrhizobium sp. USDA 10063]
MHVGQLGWRSLEISVWMFDSTACASGVLFAIAPFVNLEALGALSALLDQVLKTDASPSTTQLTDAYGALATTGEDHGTEDGVSDLGSAQTAPPSPGRWICSQAGARPARPLGPTCRGTRGRRWSA